MKVSMFCEWWKIYKRNFCKRWKVCEWMFRECNQNNLEKHVRLYLFLLGDFGHILVKSSIKGIPSRGWDKVTSACAASGGVVSTGICDVTWFRLVSSPLDFIDAFCCLQSGSVTKSLAAFDTACSIRANGSTFYNEKFAIVRRA